MIWVRKSIRIEEAAVRSGVEERRILEFIQNEWITPASPNVPELDEEDIARLRLITQLQDEFGVNEEGIPIILHLLDQIHCMRYHAKKRDE